MGTTWCFGNITYEQCLLYIHNILCNLTRVTTHQAVGDLLHSKLLSLGSSFPPITESMRIQIIMHKVCLF